MKYNYLTISVLSIVLFPLLVEKLLLSEEMKDFANQCKMKIITDVFPKEVFEDDAFYIILSVKNLSPKPITIGVHDLFENYVFSAKGNIENMSAKIIPGFPTVILNNKTIFGSYSSQTCRNIEIGNVTISPGHCQYVFADKFIALASHNNNSDFIKENAQCGIKILVFAKKYKNYIQNQSLTIHIKQRYEKEKVFIEKLFPNQSHQTVNYDKIETLKGNFLLHQFWQLTEANGQGRLQHPLRNLSEWQTFENILSPGTLRDEIRLGRIQVQYLDGDEKALDELKDWFAVMSPIQRMVLVASLALPEGLDSEEKEQIFVYGYTQSLDEEKYKNFKNYMAMRREIDKIVQPYNTLPKRKMREKSAY